MDHIQLPFSSEIPFHVHTVTDYYTDMHGHTHTRTLYMKVNLFK